jgi:glycosyltransferase involved in cell wall biosynthesis
MMPEYKISIIVPVYNVEQYLDDAMNSLVNQTIGFDNLQVIFADDCSTDRSGKIIDDYAEKYSNVQVIHLPENSGAAGTPQNEAMKLAVAPYLMILGSDDYFTETACQILYNKAEETGAEVVYGDHKTVDEDGNVIYAKWPPLKEVQDKTFVLPQDLVEAVRLRDTICTKIYNRSFLIQNELDFPVHIPGQDLVFYCKCLTVAKHIEYFPEPIYVYRIRAKRNPSISHVKTQNYFIGIEQCYRMCYEAFKKANSLSAFDVLLYGVLDDYTSKMIDSLLAAEILSNILKSWQWLYSYVFENQIIHANTFSDIIMQSIIHKDFETAAYIVTALRPLKSYLRDVLEANVWLKSQVNNYQKSYDNQEKVISELSSWTKQLEDGKNYLESQWNIAKEEKERIAAHCSEIESQLDELNNTASRLNYKLNVLLNDVRVQKIIKKKKYDI